MSVADLFHSFCYWEWEGSYTLFECLGFFLSFVSFPFSKFSRNLGHLRPSVFYLLIGPSEYLPLLRRLKFVHAYCASTGLVYHLNPILVLLQDFPMSTRHGELSHYLPDILSGASPTRAPGRQEGWSKFPHSLELWRQVIKLILAKHKNLLEGKETCWALLGPSARVQPLFISLLLDVSHTGGFLSAFVLEF